VDAAQVVDAAQEEAGADGERPHFRCDARVWARAMLELKGLFAVKIQRMWRGKRHFRLLRSVTTHAKQKAEAAKDAHTLLQARARPGLIALVCGGPASVLSRLSWRTGERCVWRAEIGLRGAGRSRRSGRGMRRRARAGWR
jgi:hypothetical protein